jgi:hypothetical protein
MACKWKRAWQVPEIRRLGNLMCDEQRQGGEKVMNGVESPRRLRS